MNLLGQLILQITGPAGQHLLQDWSASFPGSTDF
jgi:hypothetical protein